MFVPVRFVSKIPVRPDTLRSAQRQRMPNLLSCWRSETSHHGNQLSGVRRLTSSSKQEAESMTMWQRFLAPKEMPERNTAAWYREMVLICTVFAITGSSTMMVRTHIINAENRRLILHSACVLYLFLFLTCQVFVCDSHCS